MRNPLTGALAAMALHTLASLAFGWPVPSVGTFVAGLLAVTAATLAPRAPSRATSGMAAFVILMPPLVPLPLLAAGLAASATVGLAEARDPLPNLAVALPALTVLLLALTL